MSDTCVYEAFRRRIVADDSLSLPLPLSRAPDLTNWEDGYPSIRVRRDGLAPAPRFVGTRLERVYADPAGRFDAYVADDETVYWFDDAIGTMRVRGGTEITVSPESPVSDTTVGRFVVGPGLRTAVGQQGDFVLHASAVVVDGKTVAFTGPSGRGKSTAAAACAARGHTVLADDATVIARGTSSTVLPGTDRLNLDDETSAVLNDSKIGADESDDYPGNTGRYEPRTLTAIYVLEDGIRFETTPLSPTEAAMELLGGSDALYTDDDREALESHMTRAGTLAETVTVTRFQRPRSLSMIHEFVSRLEAEL
ncbi:hypothetical protein [Halomontanus rarus]|uniref:hypothetical protein n=1 Tax=Halomontanus rarus TaxID=3034020 RepID=UPI0023E802F8|nr:hypothetical protein [Halovivax sp. TS33]